MTDPTDAAAPDIAWTPDISNAEGPIYRAIADRLAHDVRGGILPVGTRLPPQRELAWRLGVTLGTVSRAYREAEHRGLIGGEVGRGTFVRGFEARIGSLLDGPHPGPGTPWSAGDPVMEESLEGPETGPIAMQSNVPPPGPEAQIFRRTLAEMSETQGMADLLAYNPRDAARRFRRAGVEWLSRRGLDSNEDDIALSAGAHNGLTATMATILKPGQRLMTEALTYPGIKTVASLLNLTLVPGEMDEEGLTAECVAIEAAAGRIDAIYTVPVLQNPTNGIQSEARRAEIAAICERYEIPIIEDDICGLFIDDAPPPLARHAPSMGYYVTSLSKTLAPGLRIGYVHTPRRMRDHVAASVRASTWMASHITAEIATRWIESGAADRILAERKAALTRRNGIAREIFEGHDFRMPEGALHLWLTLPREWRASQFVAAAAARDVVLTAAHAFTVGEAPSPGAVRICLGGPREDARVVEGLTRLRRILEEHDPLAETEVM